MKPLTLSQKNRINGNPRSSQTDVGCFTRSLVFQLLEPLALGTQPDNRYHLNDQLQLALRHSNLSECDQRLVVQMVMGITKDWFALNHLINSFCKPAHLPLDPALGLVLKIGFYQCYGLDRVPLYAAISTTMTLAKKQFKKRPHLTKLVYAILNAYKRSGTPMPNASQHWPSWFLNRMQQQWPSDVIQIWQTSIQEPQPCWIYVNSLKTSVQDAQRVLSEAKIKWNTPTDNPQLLFLPEFQGSPTQLPKFEEGWFYRMNASSAEVGELIPVKPGQTILEIGAAPGSKTLVLANRMQNSGRLLAIDISESRLQLLKDNCRTYGLSIVEPQCCDILEAALSLPLYDHVVLDAPCSGTGVLQKHPDILIQLQPDMIEPLCLKQKHLLVQAARWVKPGGTLTYSTCSMDMDENEQLVQAWLETQDDQWQRLHMSRVVPSAQRHGFFAVCLAKRTEHAN